jgi:hypothetical protein
MADKFNPMSPARKLQQQLNDLEAQHQARGGWEDLPQHAGPMPTLYNVGTGEWDQVTPDYGRLKGVPLGAPRVDPAMLNRMWRGGSVGETLQAPPAFYDPDVGQLT